MTLDRDIFPRSFVNSDRPGDASAPAQAPQDDLERKLSRTKKKTIERKQHPAHAEIMKAIEAGEAPMLKTYGERLMFSRGQFMGLFKDIGAHRDKMQQVLDGRQAAFAKDMMAYRRLLRSLATRTTVEGGERTQIGAAAGALADIFDKVYERWSDFDRIGKGQMGQFEKYNIDRLLLYMTMRGMFERDSSDAGVEGFSASAYNILYDELSEVSRIAAGKLKIARGQRKGDSAWTLPPGIIDYLSGAQAFRAKFEKGADGKDIKVEYPIVPKSVIERISGRGLLAIFQHPADPGYEPRPDTERERYLAGRTRGQFAAHAESEAGAHKIETRVERKERQAGRSVPAAKPRSPVESIRPPQRTGHAPEKRGAGAEITRQEKLVSSSRPIMERSAAELRPLQSALATLLLEMVPTAKLTGSSERAKQLSKYVASAREALAALDTTSDGDAKKAWVALSASLNALPGPKKDPTFEPDTLVRFQSLLKQLSMCHQMISWTNEMRSKSMAISGKFGGNDAAFQSFMQQARNFIGKYGIERGQIAALGLSELEDFLHELLGN